MFIVVVVVVVLLEVRAKTHKPLSEYKYIPSTKCKQL